jgi:chemotaxis protein methyltransferase CheR
MTTELPRIANQSMRSQYASCSASSGTPTAGGSRHRVGEIVRRAAGLRVRDQDFEALSRWIAGRASKLMLPGIGHYGALLAENSAVGRRERELLTVQFTTGESYFFRDRGQFDLLALTILPELIERRAAHRSLRIWSAGCAAGEEAYSLAMLVDEMAPRLAGWNILILGTDINAEAVNKARLGVYGDWSFRALDAGRKRRYFRPSGDRWRIDPRLCDMVTFRSGDLIRDRFPDAEAGMNDFDLILCRNVFIYLDPRAVARITSKFARALADEGYLVTGHSELFGHDTAPLRVRIFAQSAVFQKTERSAAATGPAESLAKAQAAIAAALRLPRPPGIGRQTWGSKQRAVPGMQSAAPAEDRDTLMQTAWLHANRGMPDQAQEDCRKAIAIAAFDPRPYYLLAQLAQERGDAREAKALLKKVIYLDSSFIAAYLELGALHAQAGDNERARRMYETVRTALGNLPAKAAVAPYGESTATDIRAYVEHLLGGSAGAKPAAIATAGARQQQNP